MRFTTRQITQAALIAAAYLVLTMAFIPISFGLIQFRIAEALMLLAAITPAAIPGLFVGCILANLIGGFGLIDIIFGSIATLIAALVTYYGGRMIPARLQRIKPFLLPLPTIIFNGLIVGGYLPFIIPEIRSLNNSLGIVLVISIGAVMIGELVVTYVLGIPLYFGIKRTRIFRSDEGL
ncbi:MAG: QueT transporter family protein [Saccharofermentanales bacterium]